MSKSGIDFSDEYNEYLKRVEAEAGDSPLGSFFKHEGQLVKKLRADEFNVVYKEYFDLAKMYIGAIDRGDTINDAMVHMLRKKAKELFLESPA